MNSDSNHIILQSSNFFHSDNIYHTFVEQLLSYLPTHHLYDWTLGENFIFFSQNYISEDLF
jgi:hypothetical protein